MRRGIWAFVGILLIIIAIVLIIWFYVVIKPPVDTKDTITTTNAERPQHWDHTFRDIDRGDRLSGEFEVVSGPSIDFYIMDDVNYQKIDNDPGNVTTIYTYENATSDFFEVKTTHGGRWWLIFSNDIPADVRVHSIIDPVYKTIYIPFLGDLHPFVLIGIVFIIVGLLMLIVYAVKDEEEHTEKVIEKEVYTTYKTPAPVEDFSELDALEMELEGMLKEPEAKMEEEEDEPIVMEKMIEKPVEKHVEEKPTGFLKLFMPKKEAPEPRREAVQEVKEEEDPGLNWILLRTLERQLKELLLEKDFDDQDRLRKLLLLEQQLEKLLASLIGVGKKEGFLQLDLLEEELKKLLMQLELLKDTRTLKQIEELKIQLRLLLDQLNNIGDVRESQKVELLRRQLLKLFEDLLWFYEKQLGIRRQTDINISIK